MGRWLRRFWRRILAMVWPVNNFMKDKAKYAVPIVGIMCVVAAFCWSLTEPWAGSISRQCQQNLTLIDGAKEQLSLDSNNPRPNKPFTWEELATTEFISKIPLRCPSGNDYIISSIGTDPVCTAGLPGHSLSEIGPAITALEMD